jgi:hypothetical protein
MIAELVISLLLSSIGSLQAAPPPPEVSVIWLIEAGIDSGTMDRSEGTLTSLNSRRYVTVHETATDKTAFTPCLSQGGDTVDCIEQGLSRQNARPGEIVIWVQAADDGFRWTCVGRPTRAFDASHQVFRRIFRPRTDDDLNAMFNRASACLTYAGHQSGW